LEKHEYPLEERAGDGILVSDGGDSKPGSATAAKSGLVNAFANALAGTRSRRAIIDKIA